ncbi:MAG: transcriptional regulator protein [Methermicoccaceae archaeon]
MKETVFKVLDPDEDEVVQILMQLGLKRTVACVLGYIRTEGEATSRDLELGAMLRQPEVSLAMRELKESGWIKETDKNKPGKGRPYKVYTLEVSLKKIIEELEEQKRLETEQTMKNIQKLKEIVGE